METRFDVTSVDDSSTEFKDPKMLTLGRSRKRWSNVDIGSDNMAFDGIISEKELVSNEDHWSDNENTIYDFKSSRQSVELPVKSWNTFVTLPSEEEDETLSSEWMNNFIKCFKILAYLLTFLSVLICAVLSKSLLLLMTSMIKIDKTVTLCSKDIEHLARGKTFAAYYGKYDPERLAWIWSLFFVMISPTIITIIRCLNNCIFKKFQNPKLITFATVFIIETLSTIGLVLLVFNIFPALDSTLSAMITNSICLIPSILTFISRSYSSLGFDLKNTSMDVFSVIIQITSLAIWLFIAYNDNHKIQTISIPIALVLISLGFWENYFHIKTENKIFNFLNQIKEDLNKSRYFTYLLISLWKLLLIFITMILYFYISEGNQTVESLFNNKVIEAFSKHAIHRKSINGTIVQSINTISIDGKVSVPSNLLAILFLQIACTFICYRSAKFACKICIQKFSFTFPLTIVGPFTILLINTLSRLRIMNICSFVDSLQVFDYIFWNTSLKQNEWSVEDQWTTIDYLKSFAWLLSLWSQIWITFHIWKPHNERLSKDEDLFMSPSFCSVLIDQSLVLNRKVKEEKAVNLENIRKKSREDIDVSDDEVVRIHMCATMWHETDDEMVQMLKSVVRMDSDQSARRHARQWFHVDAKSVDYYEIETHIFFDDAFETDENNVHVVNEFVKQLIEVMDTAVESVHQCQIHLKRPKISSTPYGGRLVWTLPGQNKLYVHMKDKSLIRHRKRWSQVMYMYYLLGFGFKDIKDEEKRNKMSENTFILALDGDINFRPDSVRLLVDLMKKHKNLGAACGRIHPVGRGPMVWYQMFEYAVSHWLQKAAEHVFGCVLCSPGCFSLFRAKALMSENVMNKYSKKPSEALHYVQYDQGEDRWLCTLLLQQGWRVEYCAASDAYTHAPEEFSEFYTQRRRWGPSTMANIMDLLIDYKHTVKVNENISTLYIIYQSFLMVGTLLSPGTIFLMVVGAMITSFGLTSQWCLLISGVPILIYIFICFTTENDTQILFSTILSTAYALIMLAVIVSAIIEIVTDGLWNPTSIFFVSLCLTFVIAAILHPTEFVCLLPFILYMLCIPSMYLLLTIYSIINLNVVSWGTREVAHKVSAEELNEKMSKESESKFLDFMNINRYLGKKSGCFQCICCSDHSNDDQMLLIDIKRQLNDLNDNIKPFQSTHIKMTETSDSIIRNNESLHLSVDEVFENDNKLSVNKTPENLIRIPSKDYSQTDRLFWESDEALTEFPIEELDAEELEFWRDFIDLYLLPLNKDPKHEEIVANDLKTLRNRVSFAFGLLNSLFILLVLLLQMHSDIFNIRIEMGKENGTATYNEDTMQYDINHDIIDPIKIEFDIIGLVLVIFFGFILLIQFLGMISHRFNTFQHLLAFIELSFCQRNKVIDNEEYMKTVINENAVTIAKELQKLNSIDNYSVKKVKHSTSHGTDGEIEKPLISKKPQFTKLEDAFVKRCLSLGDNFSAEDILPESKLTRNGRNRTINGRDVRRRLYAEVSKETVRRKQIRKH